MLRKRIALILAAALVLTSVQFTGRITNAEILPEMATEAADTADQAVLADGLDVTDIGTDKTGENEPDYVEGDVIVCMAVGEDGAPVAAGEIANDNTDGITNDKAGEIMSLIDGAEGLMDVTEAVKETDLYEPYNEQESGDDPVANDKALPGKDEEFELKYIHSDKYSTQQLIDMLEGTPGVLFAEPNYIYHLTDEASEATDEPVVPDEAVIGDEEIIREGRTLEENMIGSSDVIFKTDEITEEEEAIDTTLKIADADIVKAPDISEEGSTEAPGIIRDTSAGNAPDATGLQYAYGDGPGGIDVPYWNNEGYKNAENTVVAVLDSGVDYNHEDLKEVMWDDGLMYPELTDFCGGRYGYNAIEADSEGNPYNSFDPMDDRSHGTHCAGSVGAPWNGIGVSGTANGTEIMAVKAFNDKGSGYSKDLLKGFNYICTAREAGVNIVAVNNSWGNPVYENSYRLAAKELDQLGVVCCFAAGNETCDNDYYHTTGYSYRGIEGAIVVNSNDIEGKESSFTNFGVRTTDVSAPGSDIMSTVPTGTGVADPKLCPPVRDISGNEARDDYNSEELYFNYTCLNGASREIVDDGEKKVLKVKDLPKNTEFMTVTSGPLVERPEYFMISDRSNGEEHKYHLAMDLKVLLNNGDYALIESDNYTDMEYACDNTYKLPEDMNLETPEIIMVSYFRPNIDCSSEDYYIECMSFAKRLADYGYKSGTSMATPAVTGEVAVLASKWPDDSVARRTARVIGSTEYKASLAGTSRTDGIANVRKALDCDYAPVVNKAWVDDHGLLNISGYFFGNSEGRVLISAHGTELENTEITTWEGQEKAFWADDGKNAADTVRVSLNGGSFPANEVKITVTSSEGRSGSRMLTIAGLDDSAREGSYYRELLLPSPDDGELYKKFSSSEFGNSAGLDGYIYYTSERYSRTGDYYTTWRYRVSGNEAESPWKKMSSTLITAADTNICAWNRTLVYMDKEDKHIKMYSPDEDNIYDTGIMIPGINDMRFSSAYMVNAANDLYLLLTVQERNEKKEFVNDRTQLYKIDIKNKCALYMDTLKTIQDKPVLTADKDEAGKTVIHALSKKDEESGKYIVAEKIELNGDKVISLSGNDVALPGDFKFNNETALKGGRNQYGIVLAGPADNTNNADNLLYSLSDGSIIPCEKQIVPGRPGNIMVTEYRGMTYFLCLDSYNKDGSSFVCADNDEFKGTGEAKEPLHYYGEDEVLPAAEVARVEVELKPENDGNVPVGKSIRVKPEYTERKGKKITYTWYSEDATVAGVDQTGKVTGKMNGYTYIHVLGRDSAGTVYEGKCKVQVYSIATGIKLSPTKLTVSAGDEFTLWADLTPGDALKDKVEWSLSVPSSYPGAVEKIDEGTDYFECSSYATFKTYDVGEKLQFKVTARTTDGSNKKASCTVTVVKPGGGIIMPDPVKSASLSETGTIYLGTGMEHELSLVRVKPEVHGDYTVEWKSSNPKVVTVSGNETDGNAAVIKGVMSGTAKITAVITNVEPGGKKTITVRGLTVKVVQSSLSGNSLKIFNKKKDITNLSDNRLPVGKKLTLNATAYSDGKALKAKEVKVIWYSSDPEVATVVNGKVKAYKEGDVTFTASLVPTGAYEAGEEVIAKCGFYCYHPAKSIRLYQYDIKRRVTNTGFKNVRIASGETVYFEAVSMVTKSGLNDQEREYKDYSWTSSNPDVVGFETIPNYPEIIMLTPKKAGKSVITCKVLDGSKKSIKCTVTVYERVTGVTITAKQLGSATVNTYNAKELTVRGLSLKKTFKIQANLQPATASNKAVTYVSSNPKAVTVNKKGLVKRVGEGEADIYVTTVDGGYTAVCHVK